MENCEASPIARRVTRVKLPSRVCAGVGGESVREGHSAAIDERAGPSFGEVRFVRSSAGVRKVRRHSWNGMLERRTSTRSCVEWRIRLRARLNEQSVPYAASTPEEALPV